MITGLLLAIQSGLLALVAYNLVIALFGWPDPKIPTRGMRNRPIRVVVAAFNEENVIRGILSDLQRQVDANYTVTTLADRCTDQTAVIAAEYGLVATRSDGPDGKGAALAWYLDTYPLKPAESLVVLDADNRVDADLLLNISDALDSGSEVVQCYLDTLHPDATAVTTASALTYWAGNRMVQLARANLGWSADLGGTGMAFTAEALSRVHGFSASLTEDQDLAIRLALADTRVHWLHHVKIRDEKPAGLKIATRQRARWATGKRAALRVHGGSLLKRFLRTGRMEFLDHVIRLAQPSRSFFVLLSGMTTAAAASGLPFLFDWTVWFAATVIQVVVPIPFLVKERVERRFLLRYPLVMLVAILWIPVQVISRLGSRGWFHTPHGDEPS